MTKAVNKAVEPAPSDMKKEVLEVIQKMTSATSILQDLAASRPPLVLLRKNFLRVLQVHLLPQFLACT